MVRSSAAHCQNDIRGFRLGYVLDLPAYQRLQLSDHRAQRQAVIGNPNCQSCSLSRRNHLNVMRYKRRWRNLYAVDNVLATAVEIDIAVPLNGLLVRRRQPRGR